MPAPHLPLELLDPIVDLVCDSQAVLRNSCLISKSWIQPARRHLFANIRFHTVERLRSWRETFPDPSKSPARYAKILIVDCIQAVTAADAEASGWIRGFSSVVRLALREESRDTNGPMISLLPFHGFSPVIKSLPVDFYSLPPSQVFDLILSFPLLEDLHVITRDEFKVNNGDGYYRRLLITVQPPNQPMNGYLELSQLGGIRFIASGLLSLPSGIHFRRLALKWSMPEDISLTMALVEGCSHTLEYLEIACGFLRTSSWDPLPPW